MSAAGSRRCRTATPTKWFEKFAATVSWKGIEATRLPILRPSKKSFYASPRWSKIFPKYARSISIPFLRCHPARAAGWLTPASVSRQPKGPVVHFGSQTSRCGNGRTLLRHVLFLRDGLTEPPTPGNNFQQRFDNFLTSFHSTQWENKSLFGSQFFLGLPKRFITP